MEGAFTHMGNHLVSDSAATINAGAGDDESILDGDLSRGMTASRRRRMDDEETDMYDDDDDAESMVSMPVDGANGKAGVKREEEEVELPAHACAYVPEVSHCPRLTEGQLLRHPQRRQRRQVLGLQ